MYINKKTVLPSEQANKPYSMYVFIYYCNNKRFCFGFYDFNSGLWMDSDGMVIDEEFIWSYLPIKQMKAYVRALNKSADDDCATF